MAAILNSAILNLAILDSAILVFLSNSLTLAKIGSHHLHKKKPSLIHSDSTWWWQPSWILPCWILPYWIQPFCTKLWLKLIQSDSNSFILTQLDDGSHLEFSHLEFGHLGCSHLSFPLKLTHTCLDWFPPFSQKKTFTHSFWLYLMMAAILNSTMLD